MGLLLGTGRGLLQGEDMFTEGARVYNDAVITISNDTLTTLTFNSERYDTDNIHSTSSNTSRLTCRTAGIYSIMASISFAADVNGYRDLLILHNGSPNIAATSLTTASSSNKICISTIYKLSVNDYVECNVKQNSGGDLNVSSSNAFSPEFMMQRIGK